MYRGDVLHKTKGRGLSKKTATQAQLRDFITTGEAAMMIGVSQRHVTRLIIAGALTGQLIPNRWLVNRESVERLVKKRRTG